MGIEQIYNPMAGINRMITDIQTFLEPVWFELHPLMHLISQHNLIVVSLVLLAMLLYVLVIKKNTIIKKFQERDTYIFLVAGVLLFTVLNDHIIPIGESIKFNLGVAVLPMIAKFLGPIPAFVFGIAQYFIQYLGIKNLSFSPEAMILGAISGLIYAMFLYGKRTKYLRCFVTKFVVNIVCNIILAPMVLSESMSEELAQFISSRLIENVFMVPLQALAIYLLLKIARKLKTRFLG